MKKAIVALLTILTMGCYDPPEAGVTPTRIEIRYIYVYPSRYEDSCYLGSRFDCRDYYYGYNGRYGLQMRYPLNQRNTFKFTPPSRIEPRKPMPQSPPIEDVRKAKPIIPTTIPPK